MNCFSNNNTKIFSINKIECKTSYATVIADRFIRTVREKLEDFK